MVSHTDRFCRKFLESGGVTLIKEWGAWLRAPPRRLAGQAKSKWLRDDGDSEWEFKMGKSNDTPKSGAAVDTNDTGENTQGRDLREVILRGKDKATVPANHVQVSSSGLSSAKNLKVNGPGIEELDGLAFLERKRRREGTVVHEVIYSEDGAQVSVYNNNELYNTGATLSAMDCTASSPSDLATLAMQASHPQ